MNENLKAKFANMIDRWQFPTDEDKEEIVSLMQSAYELALNDKHAILDSSLIQDNVSEALYEVIEEGGSEFNMLVCEAQDKDGELYQLHIRAIRMNHADSIQNNEEMPLYGINNEHRLCILPPTTSKQIN